MKGYTDLEQSKKLAEFLPLESADMYYSKHDTIHANTLYGSCDRQYFHIREQIPCWSLAALLGVFENNGFFYKLYFDGVFNVLEVNIDNRNIHEIYYDDYSVDACYEIIIKLHELKML